MAVDVLSKEALISSWLHQNAHSRADGCTLPGRGMAPKVGGRTPSEYSRPQTARPQASTNPESVWGVCGLYRVVQGRAGRRAWSRSAGEAGGAQEKNRSAGARRWASSGRSGQTRKTGGSPRRGAGSCALSSKATASRPSSGGARPPGREGVRVGGGVGYGCQRKPQQENWRGQAVRKTTTQSSRKTC